MAGKRRAERHAGSYTPREEQETMLGLPTKEPEQVTPEAALLRHLHEGTVSPEAALVPEARLRQVVARYRPPRVPEGQLGLGTSFGASADASQVDLFDRKR
jgi:hypothetical protein